MSSNRSIPGLIFCFVIPAVLSGSSTASAWQGKTIEVFRGKTLSIESASPAQVAAQAVRSSREPVTPTVTNGTAARSEPRRTQVSRELADQLSELDSDASRLAEESFDSFRRGLMSLPDHLEQIKLAKRAGLVSALNPESVIQLQVQHVERLDRIVRVLRRFNQPNAEGWSADGLLASTLLAQARSGLATLTNNSDSAGAFHADAVELARLHLAQRREDSVIGIATLPMVVNGRLVSYSVTAPEEYTELAPEEFLQDAVNLTRSWQQRGAGIGRPDRVALAEYQLARFNLRKSLESEGGDIGANYRAAEVAAGEYLRLQLEYRETGTASLYDVARAWTLRHELSEILWTVDMSPSEKSELSLRDDLQQIARLAEGTKDRRGRIRADVSFIQLLGSRQRALAAFDNEPVPEPPYEETPATEDSSSEASSDGPVTAVTRQAGTRIRSTESVRD